MSVKFVCGGLSSQAFNLIKSRKISNDKVDGDNAVA